MPGLRLTFHPAATGPRVLVPLATDAVKAGFPSPSENYLAPEIDLNDLLIQHREATFYVRISGDSMTDAGILDGDLAVVDKSLAAKDGDIVIAFVNGEFTIKQFRIEKDRTRGWLVPWNDRYPRIEVNADDDFRIWGVVTHVIHSLRH
ncbi:MAG: translesion error-prone DNA polymerase V autoproteolytic subunit [Bacteroidales bacterium]|nr:translesion error-prone DNA polymerase V autoproteolytic subunit [Bacteroidales bacterium]